MAYVYERPSLDELTEHANVGTKWYLVGVQLHTDPLEHGINRNHSGNLLSTELDGIQETNKSVTGKMTAMYQLWLETNPAATRRQLLEVLRKPVIGENTLAYEYEKWIKSTSEGKDAKSFVTEKKGNLKDVLLKSEPSANRQLTAYETSAVIAERDNKTFGHKGSKCTASTKRICPTLSLTGFFLIVLATVTVADDGKCMCHYDATLFGLTLLKYKCSHLIGPSVISSDCMPVPVDEDTIKDKVAQEINYLVSVLSSLNKKDFGSISWQDLGLELGLDVNTLKSIETICSHPKDSGECLIKTLTEWFGRVYGINENGKSTLTILLEALKKIDRKPAADSLYKYYYYYKALNEGNVSVKWSKFSLSGPPGSGKSSVMKLLLNEEPPLQYKSTHVAEPQVRHVKTTSISSWKSINSDSLKKMIAQVEIKIDKGEFETSTHPNMMNNKQHPGSSVEEDDQHSSPRLRHGSSETADGKDTSYSRLTEVHLIYGVDSGGQAAFLDIAPALIRYNSVNILTHRLNESLNDKPKFIYSVHGKPVGEPIERQITHLQLLQASIRSSAFITLPDLQLSTASDPIFLIVGTFYDKINNSKESLSDKNGKLLSQFERYLECETLKWYKVQSDHVIYPVNAIDRGNETVDLANKIRLIIQKNYIEALVPVRWFLFQLQLEDYQKEHSNTSIVSLSDCERIGESLKMDSKDVKAALQYFNDLTIFLYFPSVLPQVVFLHPQLLFDKLSDLISISFADTMTQLQELDIFIPDNFHRNLKIKGTFEIELLQQYLSNNFTTYFTAADFIKLMEYLFVVASLPPTKDVEYFLPSVLPTCNSSQLKLVKKDFENPLVLTWEERTIPQGLFPALVVSLLKSTKFKLNQKQKRYRNAIQLFSSTIGVKILLVDAIYSLEVYCTVRKKSPTVREQIYHGINSVAAEFKYIFMKGDPKESFLCDCEGETYICYPNDDKMEMISECGNCIVPMNESQLCWFSDSGPQTQAQEEVDGSANTHHTAGENKPAPKPPPERYPEVRDFKTEVVQFSGKLVQDVDYLLVTVTEPELRAVMGYLQPLNGSEKICKTKTTDWTETPFYLGMYGKVKVAVLRTEEGPFGASEYVRLVLNDMKQSSGDYPSVISVGYCYGMKKDKVKLGSILVSSIIPDFTMERQGETSHPRKDPRYPAGRRLLRMFRTGDGFKLDRGGGDFVEIVEGPIIAKPVLVDNEKYKENLSKAVPDAIGGEMEGAGIKTAIDSFKPSPEFIIIKAVADWGDGNKEASRGWKPFASHASAQYVYFKLNE